MSTNRMATESDMGSLSQGSKTTGTFANLVCRAKLDVRAMAVHLVFEPILILLCHIAPWLEKPGSRAKRLV
jgi:hypothetical protein